jgi:ATP-dependent DNA ligase
VGWYRGTELEVVGRTVKLNDDQAAAIGKLLEPAGARHSWPHEISTHWGSGSKTPIIKVQPKLVVEVAANAARQAGHYRHPLRLVRHTADRSVHRSLRVRVSRQDFPASSRHPGRPG